MSDAMATSGRPGTREAANASSSSPDEGLGNQAPGEATDEAADNEATRTGTEVAVPVEAPRMDEAARNKVAAESRDGTEQPPCDDTPSASALYSES